MSDIWVDDKLTPVNNHTGGEHEMYGLNGNDNLLANGTGFNRMYGGDGDDNFLNYADAAGGFIHIYGGEGNDRADGGNLSDLISGDAGNDNLTGWAGSDEIYGGSGDDQLFGFWNTGEFPDTNDGNDAIYGGSGNDSLSGQVGDDFLSGDQGNDLLKGGPGADTMSGGLGADTFLFDQVPVKGGPLDSIVDFKPADDTIQLDDAAFADIGPAGALKGGKFFLGGKAQDGNDRIGYNPKSGALIYDSNGDDSGGKIVFAQLDASLKITKADFFVV